VVHTQRDIASLRAFLDSENILTIDLESILMPLQPQPGGSLSTNPNLQPYHSSPAQVHENLPSVALASTGVDPPKCDRSHQVELIVTNSTYSVELLVTMSSPASTHGTPVEHRRENKIVLEIEIRPRSMGLELPWDCIRIPRTKSVRGSTVPGNKRALNFKLEVQSATTGRIRDALCERCTEKESRNSLIAPTLVDFTSKTNIIDLKDGKAQVTFRFLCLSTHHGLADSEYW